MGNCTDGDKGDNTLELENIYIKPLFQRKNIGTQIVNYFLRTARERNKEEVILWVFEKNIDAVKFYTKMGFVPDGKKGIVRYLTIIMK